MKLADALVREMPDLSKVQAKEIVNVFGEAIREELMEVQEVSIPNVGKLKLVKTEERNARNPRTGEALVVPPSMRVRFKPTSNLRAEVKSLC